MADFSFKSLAGDLTLEEKVSLLSGKDFCTTPGVARLNIPPLKTVDSVNGVRPHNAHSHGAVTTVCFPSTTCYGSTWNTELMFTLGEHLARQAKLKSAQVVLGPTLNIHRDARAGRNFECWSEDPLLTGVLSAAVVNGIQKHGVGACCKHLVCNDAETFRKKYDVRESLDGRTVREIYLAAFQHLLRNSDPIGLMTALVLPARLNLRSLYQKMVAKSCAQIQQNRWRLCRRAGTSYTGHCASTMGLQRHHHVRLVWDHVHCAGHQRWAGP